MITVKKETKYVFEYGSKREKICMSNSTHTDLINALPYFMDGFNKIENLAKIVINNLLEKKYTPLNSNIIADNEDVNNLIYILQKSHPYFRCKECCSLYLIEVFTNYFQRVFLQLYDEAYSKSKEVTQEIFCSLIQNGINYFADYVNWKLNTKVPIPTISISDVHSKQDKNVYVFKGLSQLSNLFSQYFSVIAYSDQNFSNVKLKQIIAMFLTCNHYMSSRAKHCTMLSPLESLNMLYKWNFLHMELKPGYTNVFSSEYANEATDNLYKRFYESLNLKNEDALKSISDDIQKFYSTKTLQYLTATITKLQRFEDILAFEFYNMLIEGQYIKRCANCGNYFITKKTNVRYCNEHHGKQTSYQHTYKDRNAIHNSYIAYKNTLFQRKQRKRLSEADFLVWDEKAVKIKEKYSQLSLTHSNLKKFQEELNALSKELKISPPRSYTKKDK